MMSTPRLIRLRRPAVLALSPERFVASSIPLDEIDEAWERAKSLNPRLFDGELLHVQGVSRNGHGGVTLHVVESSYRFHAVRSIGVETGVRPLGVKGIVMRGGRVLMGRRGAGVHAEAQRWEFVPGGTLPPGVEPAGQVARELMEEAGWRCETPPTPIALLYDDHCHTWELVHRVKATPGVEVAARADAAARAQAQPARRDPIPSAAWEYDELEEVDPCVIADRPLTRAAELMRALLHADRGSLHDERGSLEEER